MISLLLPRFWKQLCWIVALFPLVSSHAEPIVIADDPFTDGEHYSAGGDPLGLIWFQSQLNLEVVDGDAGLGDGPALHLKASPGFHHFLTHFPAVPLEAVGDTLIVEFDYRLPAGLPDLKGGLRFGIYDSGGTLRRSDYDSSATHDDVGYGVATNPGGKGQGSGCFREHAGNEPLGGSAPGRIEGIEGSKQGPAIPADGQVHHLRLVLTRLDEGALEIDCLVDDHELTSAIEAANEVLSMRFDEFALGFAGDKNFGEITIDNFKVTASVKKPLESIALKAKKPSPPSSSAWNVHYPEALNKKVAKLETGDALLKKLRHGHPRIMMLEEDWAPLKALTQNDPIAGKLYRAVEEKGSDTLRAPLLEHVIPDGKRLLATSREFMTRIHTLGILHRLDGDPKWATRAIQEMLKICAFKDWNPSHFLDVGEMAHGMAVGYDWFYDQLTESERAEIRKAILEKAFAPGMTVYAKPSGWHRRKELLNNWNHVCNSGLIIAALAIADEAPKESRAILNAAMESLEPAMNLYAPDGAWDEGPGYWTYATNYVILCAEALRTATGSDGGIGNAPALDQAANFMLHATGATGRSFNFADASPNTWNLPACMWIGRRYQRPAFSSMYKSYIQESGASHAFSNATGLLWFDSQAGTTEWQAEPFDQVFRRVEMVSLRSSWEPNAWSISAKGGNNRFNHGNLDLGTFVLDALGMRWGMELGGDNYGLPGYFGKERFTYYRTASRGQNTITWEDENQSLDGTGFVQLFESTPEQSWAILDLTNGYNTAKTVRRGIRLTRGPSPTVLIQDEILRPMPGNLIWAMHTQANVEATGKTAILSLGGRTLRATILSPENANFAVEEVNLQAPEKATPNTRKLLVKTPIQGRDEALTLSIYVTALNHDSPLPEITPLADWGGTVVPR